jgi:hypothetical protein
MRQPRKAAPRAKFFGIFVPKKEKRKKEDLTRECGRAAMNVRQFARGIGASNAIKDKTVARTKRDRRNKRPEQ